MKIHIILLSCIYSTLAITVHYETTGRLNNNTKEYKAALKDIRLVLTRQPEAEEKSVTVRNKDRAEVKTIQKPRGELKFTRQNSQPKFEGDKKKSSSISRSENNQNLQNDLSQQSYMQKMANQLYMAQRHASVLSDYQKFIVNQDPNVKSFVLAQSPQEKTPKPFGRQRQSGRALPQTATSKYASPEPVTAVHSEYKKIVPVTPKVQQTTVRKTTQLQNDHSAQGTHVKYVTLAPQSLTHFMESQQPSPKVTLVPYQSPQLYTYYDAGIRHNPQVETVQVPTAASLGFGSYESPRFHKEESGQEDHPHHDYAKYEFMYNVKDHEKHNHFGHKESRTDKTTYGYYFVHLPDGRLETVKYWADKTGYHAKVDYQGEAKYPIHTENKLHSYNLLHH